MGKKPLPKINNRKITNSSHKNKSAKPDTTKTSTYNS